MPPRSPSLDQFLALIDELAALARAGAPLDRGLLHLGRDLPGRVGAMAVTMGRRLERGEPLERVVSDAEFRFPPLFRAVIAAGARSGNLATALQGLATATRRVREMRRLVGTAMIYPMAIVALAVLLLAVVGQYAMPRLAEAFQEWDISGADLLAAVAAWGQRPLIWAPWIPLALVVVGIAWWWRSSRAARAQVSGRGAVGRWLPTLARLSKASRMASFAELLRLLIEHRVPLPEALTLAGEATGDRRLSQSAASFAKRLESGAGQPASMPSGAELPPMLTWLVTGGAPEAQLVSALDHLAGAYRHEALRMAHWLSVDLPLILTAVIGGTTVFCYGLAVLGPAFYLLWEMGQP